jgi:proline iminopeptidase
MKRLSLLLLTFIATVSCLFAQTENHLYSKAYGDSTKPAIIFLHGGPGYNSASFEVSTAQKLADKGYYVIVYDQRGCGRSKNFPGAKFTLKESLSDLDLIYQHYHLKKAALIGHSWGGTLATFYTSDHPEKVSKLVLLSSPVSYPDAFKTILRNCTAVYKQRNDTANLRYMNMLAHLDTASLAYAGYLFIHASQCGLYTPSHSTPERDAIMKTLNSDTLAPLLKENDIIPVRGMYDDIHYTTLNTGSLLDEMAVQHVWLFGIYGDEDGLFDKAQLDDIAKHTGKNNFVLVKGSSHNVFIDQQKTFLNLVVSIMNS